MNRKAHEVGPFVIRGTITEFNEVAQAVGQSTGGSIGALGAALANIFMGILTYYYLNGGRAVDLTD